MQILRSFKAMPPSKSVRSLTLGVAVLTASVGFSEVAKDATARKPVRECFQEIRNRSAAEWTLVVGKPLVDIRKDCFNDNTIAWLVAGKDLGIEYLDKKDVETTPDAVNWHGDKWALLWKPSGNVIREGEGLPKGEDIRSAMSEQRFQPSHERLAFFLRENPENGEAMMAKLQIESAYGRNKWKYVVDHSIKSIEELSQDERQQIADQCFSGAAAALRSLCATKGWWNSRELFVWAVGASRSDFVNVTGVRQLLEEMRAMVLEQWRSRPVSGENYARIWIQFSLMLGDLRALPQLTPNPGYVVPRTGTLVWLANALDDPMPFVESISMNPPESPTQSQWDSYIGRQAFVAFLKTITFLKKGQIEKAKIAFGECKSWSGSKWSKAGYATQIMQNQSKELQVEFKDLMNVDNCEPDIPRPVERSVLNAVVFGSPEWVGKWNKLKTDETFDGWGNDELIWRHGNEKEKAALEKIYPGIDVQKNGAWAVFIKGEIAVGTGIECPSPGFLATVLRTHGKTKIQLLSDVIRTEPNQLDARSERFLLLREKLPSASVESVMLQDAVMAGLPNGFLFENLQAKNRGAWIYAASKEQAKIESTLEVWPSDENSWKTWLGWNSVYEKPMRVLDLVSRLHVWGERTHWAAKLPIELHKRALEEACNPKEKAETERWLRMAWAGCQDMMERKLKIPAEVDYRQIYKLLRAALSNLNMNADVRELDKQFDKLQKSR